MNSRVGGWGLGLGLFMSACSAAPSVGSPDGAVGGGDEDAGVVEDRRSVGPIAAGWLAPFALDPLALGLSQSVSWDFTETKYASTDPVLGVSDFENFSRADAPRSPPGVGRAHLRTSSGANWTIAGSTAPGTPRRIYLRVMFTLSDNYVAAPGREAFFTVAQRRVDDGRTLGQTTVDFRRVTLDGGVGAIALSVGAMTPNGPSRSQVDGLRLQPGQWHQLEAFLVAESDAGNDGLARVWLDGDRVIDWRDVRWGTVPSNWSSRAFINQRTTNTESDGGQYRDFDHLELFESTTRE